MHPPDETIAAVATPPGQGGVGIIRVSGPAARDIAASLLGECPEPRYARYAGFRDDTGEVLDFGIALFFPGPHSFTGEDVIELQGHGGPVVLDRVLRRILQLGARMARPGEFSERAFLNDKLDLAQAEAIADLIEAGTEQSARSAMRSLQGEFSRRVSELVEEVIEIRVFIESAIDFPEEEIDFLAESDIDERLAALLERNVVLRRLARQGALLREGMSVVIAGQPNVGKSSLLNALSGRESAIVTRQPGTTRDVLREQIVIEGMPVHVIDTAGLRESDDIVELEGINRAWREIERADRLLLVVDDRFGVGEEERAILKRLPERLPKTVIRNKIDLSGAEAGCQTGGSDPELRLSALTGEGIDRLRDHLRESAGFTAESGLFSARRRHLEALSRAEGHLEGALERLRRREGGELAAEELRLAQQSLNEITGEFSSDDLLGRIFSSFCIGK
ncbi:MAG: tRNA uridine-5-carboxymethylaminomethyl(34) synthesis GTPase MnmE [Gammaproteobacteria bacterium]